MNYPKGFVLGRFQPIHKGHQYLIDRALEQCDEVVIGIGSANVQDEKNPFSFEQRLQQIQRILSEKKYRGRTVSIVAVDDDPDDAVWLKVLINKTGKIDVVFGNNEWPNGIFEKAGYKVIRVPLYKRHIYEGTKIRKRLGI
jgi:nicotinamide-nucleotide adenylyltransferase